MRRSARDPSGRSRTRGRLAAGVLGALVAVVTVVAPATPSDAAGSYTATADARLLAVDFTTVPGVLFDQLVDAGYDVAQAQLDSLGQSSAFASNPYPSETVVLLPGLVAGLTAGATSDVVPPYPLIASSSHPVAPDQRVGVGPLSLSATSRAASSRGEATDGGGRSSAEVSYDEGSSTVVARAEASLASVTVSSALVLHGVRSVAEVRQRAGGDLERSSSFEVAAVTILGQRIALTSGGLAVLGQEAPLGIDGGALLAPLLEALAGQGTTIEAVPATETPDGITSAGLRITNTSVPPPELAAGVQEVVTRVTFGAASASISGRAFPAPGSLGPDVVDPGLPGGGSAVSPGIDPGVGPVPAGLPLAPGGRTTPPVVDAPTRPATPVSGLLAGVSVASVYPMLVVAGLVVVAIVNLFRHVAVRTP